MVISISAFAEPSGWNRTGIDQFAPARSLALGRPSSDPGGSLCEGLPIAGDVVEFAAEEFDKLFIIVELKTRPLGRDPAARLRSVTGPPCPPFALT